MKIKAVILAAAMLVQPLALIPGMTFEAAFAATTGGGGAGGPGGEGNGEKGGVMKALTCEINWNFQDVQEALRLQKQICTPKYSTIAGGTQIQ